MASLLEQNSIFTPEDQTTITQGGTVAIKVVVAVQDVDQVSATLLQTIATNKHLVGILLDVSIIKQVTCQLGQVSEENISQLEGLLTFVFPLDETMQNKKNYVVYRFHDGEVHTLTTTPNQAGEYIEVYQDVILVHALQFSTYAIGYQEPATSSNWWLWLILVIIIGGAVYLVLFQKENMMNLIQVIKEKTVKFIKK